MSKAMGEVLLEANAVAKHFGGVKALRDVLTPEQRARFDQFHQGGPMGMGKGRLGNRHRGMGWCNGSPIAPAAKP